MTYKIGQILTSAEDTLIEKGLSGERVVIPKGNKIIIGADGFAHHIKNGMLQPLPKDTEIGGYDEVGLAEYLCIILKARFPIDEMLEPVETSADLPKSKQPEMTAVEVLEWLADHENTEEMYNIFGFYEITELVNNYKAESIINKITAYEAAKKAPKPVETE